MLFAGLRDASYETPYKAPNLLEEKSGSGEDLIENFAQTTVADSVGIYFVLLLSPLSKN